MCNEAQDALGIPQDKQLLVVITKFEDHKFLSDDECECTVAATLPNYTAGNSKVLSKCDDRFLRFTAFHEAAHVKNLDAHIGALVVSAMCTGFLATSWEIFKFNTSLIRAVGYAALFDVFYIGTCISFKNLKKTVEHRADITAAYGCECYFWVNSAADNSGSNRDPDGYASSTELREIAKELRELNKRCKYH